VPHFASANGRGIAVYAFDEKTGRLSLLSETTDVANPTYLALAAKRGLLYATSETFGDVEGRISAYRINTLSGALSLINRQATRGSLTAYCKLDMHDNCAFVANYGHETPEERPRRQIVSFPVLADGGVGVASSEFCHTGSGPKRDRQSVPHAHCVVPSPDNRFAIATDLGTDELLTYRLDAGNGRLEPVRAIRVSPGAGPRHFAFHPNGAIAYVVNELDSTVCRLAYSASDGVLRILDTVAATPAPSSASQPADLRIAGSGRFLYASIRGDDTIATYGLEPATGAIVSTSTRAAGGKTPRSFALSPCGGYMLVALQDSDRLVVYRLDPSTGEPIEQVDEIGVGTPMCVQVERLD
jgi:6-phosphogluconolactonase